MNSLNNVTNSLGHIKHFSKRNPRVIINGKSTYILFNKKTSFFLTFSGFSGDTLFQYIVQVGVHLFFISLPLITARTGLKGHTYPSKILLKD